MNQTIPTPKLDPKPLLWTAPEHLRQKRPDLRGSASGDIYSFAIVLQEIVTRTGPYESFIPAKPIQSIPVCSLDPNSTPSCTSVSRQSSQPASPGFYAPALEPSAILERLRRGSRPYFRPEVVDDDSPPELVQLMGECWAEVPNERPITDAVKSAFKKITANSGSNAGGFLESLLQRMEQYANDLERMVEQKTAAFFEEKRKCEELLHEVIPKLVQIH